MLAPGTEVGRYVIKRKLAEGGMAEIFLASATGPEGFSKDVVIKVVRSFLARDSQFVQMFIAEARLVSRLNHANVVQIFDFGKHGESFYLAMEYVRGASLWDLRKRCRDQGVPFPPTLVAEIGAQVARGLQYAHALTENGQRIGVVHRDVTPHNVLLSFDGAVKLTDFGIAKATTTQTAPGMLKGKFAYMAPEQARGEKVDARTDLFALGIVLWEMLTGGRLFAGDSDLAVLRAVQDSLIAPPARLNPDVPVELSDVVMKALARAPEERFQTGFEMEKALANYVLRNARSVDDSSVALFLQQLFRDEHDAPADQAPADPHGDDDFGEGKTAARAKPGTVTATPVPVPAARSRKTTPGRRGVMDDDDAPGASTEEFKAAAPPSRGTEEMPALKRPSRKFEPLPVEPSVVLRPSLAIEISASKTEQATSPGEARPQSEPVLEPVPTKSNAPLIAVLAMLVIGLASLVGYVSTRPEELPEATPRVEAPVVVAVTEPPEADPPVEPKVEKVETPPPSVEIDAGTVVAATEPEPPKKPLPLARKMSWLSVKAVPYATVIIQGKKFEVTGVQKLPAPVGTYEIFLEHPKRKVKEKVTVQANQTTSVSFSAD
ncbi:MAG: protein kinase [Archangium sp.]|nr:protein kinase [Archangium sp.]